MLDNGGNLAPAAPTLAFTIEDRGGGPRVVWLEEPVPITVEQALRPPGSRRGDDELASVGRACDEWLRTTLSAGPVIRAEIVTKGRRAGFKLDSLRRAKARIGATSIREGFGPGAQFYWQARVPT